MGRIQFEHPFLESTLKRLGILGNQIADEPVALVVAWSSRSLLLERPEYAVLSHPLVAFLQLPQPRPVLIASLAALDTTVDPEVETLLTPLGQLRWALNALQESVASEGDERALSRLKHLHRFASQHWPGWYDPIIARLRQCIEDHRGIAEPARVALSLSGQIAEIEACRPLIAWISDEDKRERIATALDALCYASQGLLAADAVARYVYDDPWWDDVNADLTAAVTALDQGRNREPLPVVLKEPLESIAAQLTFVEVKVKSQGTQLETKTLAMQASALLENLEKLIESFTCLVRCRNSTRAKLLAKLAEDQL